MIRSLHPPRPRAAPGSCAADLKLPPGLACAGCSQLPRCTWFTAADPTDMAEAAVLPDTPEAEARP